MCTNEQVISFSLPFLLERVADFSASNISIKLLRNFPVYQYITAPYSLRMYYTVFFTAFCDEKQMTEVLELYGVTKYNISRATILHSLHIGDIISPVLIESGYK